MEDECMRHIAAGAIMAVEQKNQGECARTHACAGLVSTNPEQSPMKVVSLSRCE